MTEPPDQQVRRLEQELADALAQQRQGQVDEQSADPPGGAPDGPLAAPPRRVPAAFIAASLPWKWWEAWALFMVAVPLIALWAGFPWLFTIVGAVAIAAVIGLRVRVAWAEYALLRDGIVATVVGVDQGASGTYYSGVTYRNVRMAVARGWRVDRRWYSGPGTKTTVAYSVAGQPGSLVLHGLPYQGGVILADPRRPSRAKCVSSFPYGLDRDAAGDWLGRVPGRVWIGVACTLGLWCVWLAGLAYWQLVIVQGPAW